MVDSPGPAIARNRFVHSIASALSRVSITAQPPTSSLASENGPSSTVKFVPSYLTLVASSSGPTPPVATRTPALVASSTNAPIFSYNSGLGGGIGTDGSASVYPRNRICISFGSAGLAKCQALLRAVGLRRLPHLPFCPCVERRRLGSTRAAELFGQRKRRSLCGAVRPVCVAVAVLRQDRGVT